MGFAGVLGGVWRRGSAPGRGASYQMGGKSEYHKAYAAVHAAHALSSAAVVALARHRVRGGA